MLICSIMQALVLSIRILSAQIIGEKIKLVRILETRSQNPATEAMDFTMENLRIMDTGEPMRVDQSALVGSDEEGSDFEMRTEKMDRI
eukprot:12122569-Heterocapsa_arctica.AAC.1